LPEGSLWNPGGRWRNDSGNALDSGAVEAPAGAIAGMGKNRMNAGFRLRLAVEDFHFAILHRGRVIKRDSFERVIWLGIAHAVFEPHEIGCIGNGGQSNQNSPDPCQERFRPHRIPLEKVLQRRARREMAAESVNAGTGRRG